MCTSSLVLTVMQITSKKSRKWPVELAWNDRNSFFQDAVKTIEIKPILNTGLKASNELRYLQGLTAMCYFHLVDQNNVY